VEIEINQDISRRDWSRRLHLEIGVSLSWSPREKWAGMQAAALPRIGQALEVELIEQGEVPEFEGTGCCFADFFRDRGEPEIGLVLPCESEVHGAEVGSPQVESSHAWTIMEEGLTAICAIGFRIEAGAERRE